MRCVDDATGGGIINQHRALIFAQQKAFLDLVEADLFRAHMPTVTYRRLDGSTPANKRHGIVVEFNEVCCVLSWEANTLPC